MCDFVLNGIEYRFDYYHSMFHPIIWKEGADILPEFDIHYDKCRIQTVSDYTVYNDKGKNAPLYPETWEYYKENYDTNIKKAAFYPGF